MERHRIWRSVFTSDHGILILLALGTVLLHLLTNGQYGFHRDELATLDDGRHLAWGYVAYPPMTPFIARVALVLFGPSLVGVRFFSALAQGIVIVLAGLMARELGGTRRAQIAGALAAAITPASLFNGAVLMYTSFDYLWWVLVAYLMIRLLKSENSRWWLGIGAAVGLGMMTRYSMAFLVAGVLAGLLLTKARRYLASPWLWGGVALALLVFLPNLVWQVRHGFISLDFLSSIHARDIGEGRAEGYLMEQLLICTNPLTLPFWVAGLYYYFFAPAGRRYRALGWMYAVPFLIFLVAQGRAYYLAPAYPMLIAAGAVVGEQWLASLRAGWARLGWRIVWCVLAIGGLAAGALVLPLAPINSSWWNVASEVNGEFREEIGWPELVKAVAGVYAALPAEEKPRAGILAGNYGEAGAINLYGPAYGLPTAFSGINSYWQRGYGDPPPEVLIAVGFSRETIDRLFETAELVGPVTNRYGVKNEESTDYPGIFICRGLREPWPELWEHFRWFG